MTRVGVVLLVLALAAPAHGQDGLVAHEWGSLLQVQSAKGVVLGGGRQPMNDLPPFVLRWSTVPMNSRIQAVLKPVLYFYTDRDRVVTVRAGVPTGLYTEWWPPASEFAPRVTRKGQRVALQNGWHLWRNVAVMANKPASPAPRDVKKGWYPVLRETDASWLRVRGQHYARSPNSGGTPFDEVERFLLYRGMADEKSAIELRVAHPEAGKITLSNTGKLPLGKVLLVHVAGGAGWIRTVDAPAPGKTSTIDTRETESAPVAKLKKDGVRSAVELLKSAGLYEKEARGMARAWTHDWFADTGSRALYLVPRAKTDALLPLTITPAPRKTVRVLIGRIESITPERAKAIGAWIEKLGAGAWRDRQRASRALARLGPLAKPLLLAAKAAETDPERAARIDALIKLLGPPSRR